MQRGSDPPNSGLSVVKKAFTRTHEPGQPLAQPFSDTLRMPDLGAVGFCVLLWGSGLGSRFTVEAGIIG